MNWVKQFANRFPWLPMIFIMTLRLQIWGKHKFLRKECEFITCLYLQDVTSKHLFICLILFLVLLAFIIGSIKYKSYTKKNLYKLCYWLTSKHIFLFWLTSWRQNIWQSTIFDDRRTDYIKMSHYEIFV